MLKTGVRALLSGGLLPAERKGLTEIGISRTISPRWNRAKVEIGAEYCFASVGSLGRVCSSCRQLAQVTS